MELVEKPDLRELAPRFIAARREHARRVEQAWVGTLVLEFSNDELRLLCDEYLTVSEVRTLRRLGLLRPDEGFNG